MLRTDLELEYLKDSKTKHDKVVQEIRKLECKIFFQEKQKDKLIFMEKTLKLDLNVINLDNDLNTLKGQLMALECEKRWYEIVLGTIQEKAEFWVGDLWK